jgi:hypothetical protein
MTEIFIGAESQKFRQARANDTQCLLAAIQSCPTSGARVESRIRTEDSTHLVSLEQRALGALRIVTIIDRTVIVRKRFSTLPQRMQRHKQLPNRILIDLRRRDFQAAARACKQREDFFATRS